MAHCGKNRAFTAVSVICPQHKSDHEPPQECWATYVEIGNLGLIFLRYFPKIARHLLCRDARISRSAAT